MRRMARPKRMRMSSGIACHLQGVQPMRTQPMGHIVIDSQTHPFHYESPPELLRHPCPLDCKGRHRNDGSGPDEELPYRDGAGTVCVAIVSAIQYAANPLHCLLRRASVRPQRSRAPSCENERFAGEVAYEEIGRGSCTDTV